LKVAATEENQGFCGSFPFIASASLCCKFCPQIGHKESWPQSRNIKKKSSTEWIANFVYLVSSGPLSVRTSQKLEGVHPTVSIREAGSV